MLYFIVEFVKLKSRQRRLGMCEINIISIVITIVALNAVDTVLYNVYQIINYDCLNHHTQFYEAWTSISELFEDFIILTNGIFFMIMCLRVYQRKY